MIDQAVLTNLATAVVLAALYTYVGVRIRRRPVSEPGRLASTMFATWWVGIALLTLLSALASVGVASQVIGLGLYVGLLHILFALICVALCGLLYYLVYLYTGNRGLIWPLAAFYVVYYVAAMYVVMVSVPNAVHLDAGMAVLAFENEPTGPFVTAIQLLLVLPVLTAAGAYATLFFRTRQRTARYRVSMVSFGILCWFASSLLGTVLELGERVPWPYVSRAVGVAASLIILAAYLPPRWVRKRFGISAIGDAAADQALAQAQGQGQGQGQSPNRGPDQGRGRGRGRGDAPGAGQGYVATGGPGPQP